MAVDLHSALKLRREPFLSSSLQYRRRGERTRTKKIQKKFKVKLIHILLAFLLLTGLFVLIQQTYLFLITWDNLDVRSFEIDCQKAGVKEEIAELFQGKKLGNILLVNIDHLQDMLERHRWVKEVCVRKIFPSSLRIEVQERIPAAVVKKDKFYLIDRDGILLEETDPQERHDLPLLTDSDGFKTHYQEKLKLAWRCLDSLPAPERELIEVMDLSEYANVVAHLRGEKTRLKLGADRFHQKLKTFRQYQAKLEKFEPLEYVDLRFGDRLYLKPQKGSSEDSLSNFPKEER
jgi:cell division septal protein FtsQ